MSGNDMIGCLTCEDEHAAAGGGDADDVWFLYHIVCLDAKADETGKVIDIERDISRAEAEGEAYVCVWCGAPLTEKVNHE